MQVGDTTLTEADFTKLRSNQIDLLVPQTAQRGPSQAIVVSAGGRESSAAYYEIRPWISAVTPLRGFPGLPVTLPFEVPAALSASLQIDGIDAAVTVDAQRKNIRAIVPATIASNGSKSVVLTLNSGTPQASNVRFFEVIPQIQSVTVATVAGPATTTITVSGQRLDGGDVRVIYGNLSLNVGANANATQISVDVSRMLTADQPVQVLIDGRRSNTLPPGLEGIDPAEAFSGDNVTLSGYSLSGQTIVVSFGAVDVNIGANAYSARLTVAVPSGLAVGLVGVKLSVDGHSTNTFQFGVLG